MDMFPANQNHRRITDSARRILNQMSARAIDRGLVFRVADPASVVMLALWSVLLWERKLGLAAIEKAGGYRFDLIRALDRLLQERASELPLALDVEQPANCDKDRRGAVLVPRPNQPFVPWDSDDLLEPLLSQAQSEAKELGHDYIGSEHLVLAIVKLADPTLGNLLRDCGVTHERVREAVVDILRPEA
jgi:hypothetical protein